MIDHVFEFACNGRLGLIRFRFLLVLFFSLSYQVALVEAAPRSDETGKTNECAVCALVPVSGGSGSDCGGWYRISFGDDSYPQGSVVSAHMLALDAQGNVVATLPVSDGDVAQLKSRIKGPIVAESRANRHVITAPIPVLVVRVERDGSKTEAMCSVVPYLSLGEPDGHVVTSESGSVHFASFVPGVNPRQLRLLLNGVDLFSHIGVDPYTQFPGGPFGGTVLIDGAPVNVTNLLVDVAETPDVPSSNSIVMELSGLPGGGHVFLLTGDDAQSPAPGRAASCYDDDLSDTGVLSVFSIDIETPAANEIVPSLGPATEVAGVIRGGRTIAAASINGHELDPDGQVFTAGDGVRSADTWTLPFNVMIPRTNFAQELSSLVVDGGTFDLGWNRLSIRADDEGGNSTFGGFLFAIAPGPVAAKQRASLADDRDSSAVWQPLSSGLVVGVSTEAFTSLAQSIYREAGSQVMDDMGIESDGVIRIPVNCDLLPPIEFPNIEFLKWKAALHGALRAGFTEGQAINGVRVTTVEWEKWDACVRNCDKYDPTGTCRSRCGSEPTRYKTILPGIGEAPPDTITIPSSEICDAVTSDFYPKLEFEIEASFLTDDFVFDAQTHLTTSFENGSADIGLTLPPLSFGVNATLSDVLYWGDLHPDCDYVADFPAPIGQVSYSLCDVLVWSWSAGVDMGIDLGNTDGGECDGCLKFAITIPDVAFQTANSKMSGVLVTDVATPTLRDSSVSLEADGLLGSSLTSVDLKNAAQDFFGIDTVIELARDGVENEEITVLFVSELPRRFKLLGADSLSPGSQSIDAVALDLTFENVSMTLIPEYLSLRYESTFSPLTIDPEVPEVQFIELTPAPAPANVDFDDSIDQFVLSDDLWNQLLGSLMAAGRFKKDPEPTGMTVGGMLPEDCNDLRLPNLVGMCFGIRNRDCETLTDQNPEFAAIKRGACHSQQSTDCLSLYVPDNKWTILESGTCKITPNLYLDEDDELLAWVRLTVPPRLLIHDDPDTAKVETDIRFNDISLWWVVDRDDDSTTGPIEDSPICGGEGDGPGRDCLFLEHCPDVYSETVFWLEELSGDGGWILSGELNKAERRENDEPLVCGGCLLKKLPGLEEASRTHIDNFLATLNGNRLFDHVIDVDDGTPEGTRWTFEGARLVAVETGGDVSFQDYLGVGGLFRVQKISTD